MDSVDLLPIGAESDRLVALQDLFDVFPQSVSRHFEISEDAIASDDELGWTYLRADFFELCL